MADWSTSPAWTAFEDINNGQRFTNRLSPEDFNKLAENIAYLYQHIGESEWLGEYVDGTSYKQGAIVSYYGDVYLCIKDLDDWQDPTNAEYWKMLNEKGGGETVDTWDGTGVIIKPTEAAE